MSVGTEDLSSATIDELLDEEDDDDIKPPSLPPVPQSSDSLAQYPLPAAHVKEEAPEKEEFKCFRHPSDDIGFDFQNEDNDVIDEDMEVMDEFNREYEDEDKADEVKPIVEYPPLEEEKKNIFESRELDEAVNEGRNLSKMIDVPSNSAIEGISEVSKKDVEKIRQRLDERDLQEGLRAGLGQKKKSADRMVRMGPGLVEYMPSKAKTLAEKRKKLQEDMMKYGVAAIERLYPRQEKKASVSKKQIRPKMSPFKMVPSAIDLEFEEVDARSIIKPYSHAKYIQEPVVDTVVYINRRDGLVPLSTLGKESKKVLSSNISLVSGRNVTLGKPACYVRDSHRLVAIGGTRNRQISAIKILNVPKFDQDKTKLPLFEIDQEFAQFSASAYTGSRGRVDIRRLKKERLVFEERLEQTILSQESLLERMILKLKLREDAEELEQLPEWTGEQQSSLCLDIVVPLASSELTEGSSLDQSQDTKEEEEHEKTILVIKNAWINSSNQAFPSELNMDECPPLRGFTEGNIKPILRTPLTNSDGFTGWDSCDISACHCKSVKTPLETSPSETPATVTNSGGNTPYRQKRVKKKIVKDLERVKRALKTLGVNIIEYDDHDSDDSQCIRDYCKFGCVCESIKMKPIPPTHCGKVECMFECSCSKEALKYSSCGNRRVNISAAVGARIQENTQRHLSAEEKKFHNTVLLTADRDTVMLGGRSTKRVRKVPQRYQNSSTLLLDQAGQEFVEKTVESEEEEEEEDEVEILDDSLQEARNKMDIIPCTVIIPKVDLPANTEVWCMFHARYSCPCRTYENPCDFAPDVSKSRNKAKRSIGGKFFTKRRVTPEPRVHLDNSLVEELIKSDQEEDDVMLISDDNDTDPEKENVKDTGASKIVTGVKPGQSARTSGLLIKQSGKTQMPFKPVKKAERVFKEVASFDDKEDQERNKFLHHTNKKINDAMMNTARMTKFSLKIAPRQTFQYARWDILKEKFISGDIDIFFFVRPGRGTNLLFLTEKGQKSYIASAINLRNLEGQTHKLPSLVEECLQPLDKPVDKFSYAVLESNGFVWTFQSLLSAHKDKTKVGVKRSLHPNTPVGVKRSLYPNTPVPALKKPRTSSSFDPTKIDVSKVSQKLPVGQSMVTVTKGEKPLMQVKLPSTQSYQHWTLISTGNGETTIQCPDSHLVLKCAILQQAANLASATNTTVRIPINVDDQDPAFGVYAVPGLKSHVFVGPFSSKDIPKKEVEEVEDDDVVCLEDEEMTEVKEEDKDESFLPEESGPGSSESPDRVEESKRGLTERAEMVGQIPQLVEVKGLQDEDEEGEDDPIEILSDSSAQEGIQAKKLLEQNFVLAENNSVPDLVQFVSGRVVRRLGGAERKGQPRPLKYTSGGEEKEITVHIEKVFGHVVFLHPELADYDVMCKSVEKAEEWLQRFSKYSEIKKKSDKIVDDVVMEIVGEMPQNEGSTGVGGKEGINAVEGKDMPTVVRIEASSSSTNKSKMYGMLIQSRQEKEESKLFYDLGHTAFRQFFTKSTTKGQILVRAKKEIESLAAEGSYLEIQKQSLIKRRTKLFDDFTKALDGVPIDKKKIAVANLKKLLSSKEEPDNMVKKNTSVTAIAEQKKKVEIAVNNIKEQSILKQKPLPTPYTDVTGIDTVRADGSIIRPISAFTLWATEKKAEFLARGVPPKHLGQYLTKTWTLLNDKAKSRYLKEAKHLKILHSMQHPEFYQELSGRAVVNMSSPSGPSTLPQSTMGNLERSSAQVAHNSLRQGLGSAAAAPKQLGSTAAVPTKQMGATAAVPPKQLGVTAAVLSRKLGADTSPSQTFSAVLNSRPVHPSSGAQMMPGAQPIRRLSSTGTELQTPKRRLSSSIGHQPILPRPQRPAPELLPLSSADPPAGNLTLVRPASQQTLTSPASLISDPPTMVQPSSTQIRLSGGAAQTISRLPVDVCRQTGEIIGGNNSEVLDLSEIPADAADVLGLAVQSSGLEDMSETVCVSQEVWEHEQQRLMQQPMLYHRPVGSNVHSRQQQQQIVFLEQDHHSSMSGNHSYVVRDPGGGQQQVLLGSNLAGSSGGQIFGSQQSVRGPVYLQESEHGEVYIQADGQQVYLQPDHQGGQVYVEATEGEEAVYGQSQLADGQMLIESGDGDEMYLQSDQGEPVYVDEMGRPVIFQQQVEGDPGPQYYMQNGELFQIIEEEVTQLN